MLMRSEYALHYVCARFRPLSAIATLSYASSLAVEDAANWEIGPDVRGINYSVGMPLKPSPAGARGWSFAFPYPSREAGHVHAITYNSGPLINASKIVMRYRISAARSVRFEPQESPGQPGTVSLYFQRRGDNWSAKRKYEFYRWYIPAQAMRELSPGENEIVVSLSDPNWISVMGNNAANSPTFFREALAQTERIGIAFGGPSGRAHGVYSSGPARFTLKEFQIL